MDSLFSFFGLILLLIDCVCDGLQMRLREERERERDRLDSNSCFLYETCYSVALILPQHKNTKTCLPSTLISRYFDHRRGVVNNPHVL